VLGFVLLLVGVLTSWVPFVFVIGAVCTLAGIPLAIVALRRVAASGTRERAGRGFAVAALVLAPIAIGMAVVGVVLTRITVRELDEYRDPGLVDTAITSCTLEGGVATATGTITNLSGDERDYVIRFDFLDGIRLVHEANLHVGPVAPGGTLEWAESATVGDVDLECDIDAVNGPLPFGVDPEA
jgi:hypothetical protein